MQYITKPHRTVRMKNIKDVVNTVRFRLFQNQSSHNRLYGSSPYPVMRRIWKRNNITNISISNITNILSSNITNILISIITNILTKLTRLNRQDFLSKKGIFVWIHQSSAAVRIESTQSSLLVLSWQPYDDLFEVCWISFVEILFKFDRIDLLETTDWPSFSFLLFLTKFLEW